MAGQIKRILDRIVEQRPQGDNVIASTTRTKLILKGINPKNYTENYIDDSEDDPETTAEVKKIANELGVII